MQAKQKLIYIFVWLRRHGCQNLVYLLPQTRQGLIIFTKGDHYKVYEKQLLPYLSEVGNKIIDIEMK
jgi:hypothetical protein